MVLVWCWFGSGVVVMKMLVELMWCGGVMVCWCVGVVVWWCSGAGCGRIRLN